MTDKQKRRSAYLGHLTRIRAELERMRKRRVCVVCERPTTGARAVTCGSAECKAMRAKERDKSRDRSSKPREPRPINCDVCGDEFVTTFHNAKFCGAVCKKISLNRYQREYQKRRRVGAA